MSDLPLHVISTHATCKLMATHLLPFLISMPPACPFPHPPSLPLHDMPSLPQPRMRGPPPAVDSSRPALRLAAANRLSNLLPPSSLSLVRNDVSHFMRAAAAAHRQWDLIILDPPKLAPSKKVRTHRTGSSHGGAAAPGGQARCVPCSLPASSASSMRSWAEQEQASTCI